MGGTNAEPTWMLQAQTILCDRYELQRQLGHNPTRQTWLSRDIVSNEWVVVKLLAFGGNVQWEDLKLFEREGQVLQQLRHPRIPRYRDCFSLDDRSLWFGLVQEYIPGKSLKELLEEGQKFTEAQIHHIATEVLDILIYLHELHPPLLHRDIKPSNLLWCDRPEERDASAEYGAIYLVDFGAVQDKAAAEGKTFTVVGTYGYTPMEQYGGRAVPASDLYALGTTLVHLLAGVAPADLPQDDSSKLVFRDRSSTSPHFADWLERAIEPSVKRRFASAREALHCLEDRSANQLVRELLQLPTRRIARPQGTAVQLDCSNDRLSVRIPVSATTYERLKAIAVLVGLGTVSAVSLLLVMGIAGGVYFFWIVLAAIWGGMFYPSLVQTFGHHTVSLDRRQFTIEHRLFWFCLRRESESVDEIQDIFQSVKTDRDDREREMVTMQTSRKRYSFGLGLSALECLWIAKEMKDWLGLR